MKKLYKGLSASLVAAYLVAACTPAAGPAEPTAAGPAELGGSIRVGSWDSGDALEPFNDSIAAFQTANPGLTVNLEAVPQGYGDKLLAQFASGTAPDVFQVGDGDVAKFVAQGVIEPLDSYIGGANGIDMNATFYPAVAAFGQVGGQTYLLTKDYSPLVLYYNKALFDAAGVAYPTADWTWDDMLTAAQALTSGEGADKVWGLQIPNSWGDPYWLRGVLPLIYQNGGSIISDDGKTASGHLNSPETVAALQWYVDLFKVHGVTPTKDEVAALSGQDLFQTGRVAMLWTGRWPLKDFIANTELSFGTVQLPAGPSGRANALCWAGFAIYSQSQNKDAAWAFMRYIAAGDGATEFANYAFTAVKPVAEAQGLTSDEYNAPIIADLENVKPLPEATTPKFQDCVQKEFQTQMELIFLEDKPVQQAMDDAAAAGDACLAKP